jgi:hypothetical protein
MKLINGKQLKAKRILGVWRVSETEINKFMEGK